MKTYRVIIKNSSNCEIYNTLINANTENDAILELLKENCFTLYCDDTLTIIEE